MTNTRKKQVRTLAILLIAVVGLTIGFAAFTSSLRIKTRLSVNPNKGTFNVKFSKASDKLDEGEVVSVKYLDIFEALNGEFIEDGSNADGILLFDKEYSSIGDEFYEIKI